MLLRCRRIVVVLQKWSTFESRILTITYVKVGTAGTPVVYMLLSIALALIDHLGRTSHAPHPPQLGKSLGS